MGAIAAIFSLDSQKSASRLSARTIAFGKARWSPCDQPADVIAVHVRDVDLVDLLRRVARGLEARRAGCRAEGPKSLPAPVSIITSLLPVLIRYALTEVASGLVMNARLRSASTRSGLTLSEELLDVEVQRAVEERRSLRSRPASSGSSPAPALFCTGAAACACVDVHDRRRHRDQTCHDLLPFLHCASPNHLVVIPA